MDAGVHELRLYGHRGSSAVLPENTMEAFQQALDDGANALELDVHRTIDGHLVVVHDPDGVRTAGTGRTIRHSTLNEIRSWNVGLAKDGTGHHVMPTLIEVITRFGEVPISVDLKPNDQRAVTGLLEQVNSLGVGSRITLGSFHDRLVYRARRLGYQGPTALTRGEVAAARLLPIPLARRLVRGEVAMIPRRGWGVNLERPDFIRRCRRLGLRVDYWVVNDPETARALLLRGATGIVSDDPRRIAPILSEVLDGRQT
jgi:glycerophosphoryl diester phosphodiesterase